MWQDKQKISLHQATGYSMTFKHNTTGGVDEHDQPMSFYWCFIKS